MKQWRTTLIVVAIFVALAAYVLLVEVKREPPTEQEPTPTPLPLLSLNIDGVQSLRITGSASTEGVRVLHVARAEAEWRLSTPDKGPATGEPCLASPDGCTADPYVVHIATDDLCHLAAQRVLLEQVTELAQYGLDPISLEIEITTTSGEHQKIHIGRQTPDGMSYYMQRAGDPRLYLVAQYTLQPFFEWLKEPPYQPPPTPEPA
jgi:hypothetical protein